MPVRINGITSTLVGQNQIKKSDTNDDNLPLLEYDNIHTLEDDLSYLRSVIHNLKGTNLYDSPVSRTLKSVADELEAAIFDNVTLTGNSTAETPELSNYSDRIATTKYVTDKINERNYTHVQSLPSSTWIINHNLNRTPSVTVVDSSGQLHIGNVIYLSNNSIQVEFSAGFSGKAYLN